MVVLEAAHRGNDIFFIRFDRTLSSLWNIWKFGTKYVKLFLKYYVVQFVIVLFIWEFYQIVKHILNILKRNNVPVFETDFMIRINFILFVINTKKIPIA